MGNEIIINTKELSVGYGKKVLIPDITFSVHQGEILVLIGPNGAGKSTILKTLASQLKKITGTIMLDGDELDKLKEKDVAQKMSLLLTKHPKGDMMTVQDMVETGRYPYTGNLGILSDKDRQIVDESLKMVGLTQIKDSFFENISDGQRQRVMLARAIGQEPKVLIMDEPTSYLDIRHKLELLSMLKKLAKEKNIAVILSLHELDLAGKCADNILCLKDGYIDRYGPTDEIFNSADNYINELYGVQKGTFINEYGSLELEKNGGKPRIFVIGGGGKAIPVYRYLQKEGIPFAVGVLHENDMEYPIAKALACKVVSQKAFENIDEESIKIAKMIMDDCEKVIIAVTNFGAMNKKNTELIEHAKKQKKVLEEI